MVRRMIYGGMLMAQLVAMMASGGALYAQDHSQHQGGATETPAAAPATKVEEEHIFCPTMKTGQICSHGTAANLKVAADKQEQWVAFARKYNRAVNTATEQLFKDAETILIPEQQELLKAWFAVGLNPQINNLLYAQGLGGSKAGVKPAAAADPKPAAAK